MCFCIQDILSSSLALDSNMHNEYVIAMFLQDYIVALILKPYKTSKFEQWF
jgi:hypothetical protein